jgi:hypothetical protein
MGFAGGKRRDFPSTFAKHEILDREHLNANISDKDFSLHNLRTLISL